MRRVGSLPLAITIILAPATETAVPTTTVAPVDSGSAGVLSEWDGMRATLTVPLDRDDPDGPTPHLAPGMDSEAAETVAAVFNQ